MSATTPTDYAARRAVLDRVGALERERAVLYAKQARARAEMARLWGADQDVCVELAGTARIGQGKAGGQLARSERLVQLFPLALGLLELGVMRVGTVEILLAVTKNANAEVQQMLDTRLSERICPMDAVDVRRLVAATLLEVEAEQDEAAQRERHEKARANRGVWAFPVEDGMARIGAELDVVDARRWCLDFEELVRAQKVLDDRDGVVRTQAQRRADVFALLPSRLLGVADAAVKGRLAELQTQVDLLSQQAGTEQPPGAPASGESEAERARRLEELQAQVALMREDPAHGQVEPGPSASQESGDEPSGDHACEDDATLFDPTEDVVDATAIDTEIETDDDARPDAEADDSERGALVSCGVSRDEVLLGLLRLPVRNPATLYLHTAMSTVLDLDQRSGWLEGIGPVPAMRARMLLATASLRRVAVDETTGVPLGMDPHTGVSPPWRTEVDLPDRHPRRQRQAQRQQRRERVRPADEGAGAPGAAVRPAARASSSGVSPSSAAPPDGPIGGAPGCPPVAEPSTEQVLRERLLRLLGTPMYLTDRAEPQHDPSTALRTFVRLRDQACDGPGCPRAVSGCELDHETPYSEGGRTAIWNLKHRSPRCHHVKHGDWTVTHDHHTGISTWTSPTGSVFVRLGPWQPPTPLPDDLVLPEPRLVEPHDVAPDWDTDRPLWRDPEPPAPREPRRGRTSDEVDEHGTPLPPPPRTGPGTWYDDGPPPF